jgi:hypothetical protein
VQRQRAIAIFGSTLLLSGLGAGGAVALSGDSALTRGWAPIVTLLGDGDVKAALPTLGAMNRASDVMLKNTQLDAATEKFVDSAWKEIEDFDLSDFQKLLPQKAGAWREIGVSGQLEGNAYRVRLAQVGTPFEVTLDGPRRKLADVSAVLRAKATRAHGEHNAFLLHARAGIGIGNIAWDDVTGAVTEALRLLSTGDPRNAVPEPVVASEVARSTVQRMHPKLSAEDVEVLALLHDAFPAISAAVGEIAQVDDVRVAGQASGYHKLQAKARIVPSRLKRKYPELADHLGDLDDLMKAKIRWLDSRGRSVLEATLNTETLTATAVCYVKDGRLLPFTRDAVAADEPIDPMGAAMAKSRVVIDASVRMLGLTVHIDQLRADLTYEPRGSVAHATASLKKVPGVRVTGAALGFVPTGLVNAFIPGDIASLTRDFFDVAVRGNDGKGIRATLDLGAKQKGQPGAAELTLGVEALDNFLVKMGVAIVNKRVIPDDDETSDIDRLQLRMHQAFTQDLQRFSRASGPG